jgi:4-amino-4-deoxy-L-arabinose transferase-like glycosyltransferase
VDEAGYAYGARLWSEGVSFYSDDVWFDRPQGIFVAYRAGFTLLGDSIEAIRLWAAIWAGATAAVVVWIAARVFDRRVALVAGPLFAVVAAAPALEGFVANAEVFMLLPATAAAGCIWRGRWFAAGVLTGLAILLKPSGAAVAFLALTWLLYERESWRAWLAIAVGGAIPLAAALFHGVLMAGLGDYLYAVVLFRLDSSGQHNAIVAFVGFGSLTSSAWFTLVVLAAIARHHLGGLTRERRFVGFWLATSLLGMALGGNWWPHYWVQLIPPLAILGTVALVRGFGAAALPPGLAGRVAIGVSALAALLLIVPYSIAEQADASEEVFNSTYYLHSEEIAAYLEANTGPDEAIYVTLGHASIIYRSERRSSWPYLYAQQTSDIPGALDDAANHLRRAEPAYVVVQYDRLERWDPDGLLLAALTERYVYDRSFGELEVWRRR